MNAQHYIDQVRQLRRSACMSMDSGQHCNHALHMKLLAEEHSEFMEAHGHEDLRGKADALGDTVTIACGYILDAGQHQLMDMYKVLVICERAATRDRINLMGAFSLVHASNMSKLCTRDQIKPTQERYAELGVTLEWRDAGNGMWSAFAANTIGGIPKGKWLKGVGFTEPRWCESHIWRL